MLILNIRICLEDFFGFFDLFGRLDDIFGSLSVGGPADTGPHDDDDDERTAKYSAKKRLVAE